MEVQFLSQRERKKSLSGRKNKKKTSKNILAPPEEYDVKDTEFEIGNNSALIPLLKNLLPQAQLQNSAKKNGKINVEKMNEEGQVSENRLKRNQLLLGVNVVIKGVKNGTAACVMFSDNITPKLMTTHLKLLCSNKKVPYVHIPKFREITKKTLGFSCIVLGVKKDSVHFAPITELITTIVNHPKHGLKHFDNSKKSSSGREEHMIEAEKISPEKEDKRGETENVHCVPDARKEEKKPFVYLYRSGANGKRAFEPDSEGRGGASTSKSEDFITLGDDNEEPGGGEECTREGVGGETSGKQSRNNRNKRKLENDSGSENEGDISVVYSAVKVMKLAGNPVREKEKYGKCTN